MPRSIASRRLVNVEKFLLQYESRKKSGKTKVFFVALRPCKLALINHNSPSSLKTSADC